MQCIFHSASYIGSIDVFFISNGNQFNRAVKLFLIVHFGVPNRCRITLVVQIRTGIFQYLHSGFGILTLTSFLPQSARHFLFFGLPFCTLIASWLYAYTCVSLNRLVIWSILFFPAVYTSCCTVMRMLPTRFASA